MSTKAADYPYMSGHCSARVHHRCRGGYGGCECSCPCHTEPEPEPEPAAVLPLLLARHCETCACQGHG